LSSGFFAGNTYCQPAFTQTDNVSGFTPLNSPGASTLQWSAGRGLLCLTSLVLHARNCFFAVHKRSLCRCALSIRSSVRLSVTFVYSVETRKHVLKLFSPLGSHTILVFHIKPHGNMPTETPLKGRRMQVAYEK